MQLVEQAEPQLHQQRFVIFINSLQARTEL